MNRKLFVIMICTVTPLVVNAQVNIGTLQEPHRGAILHLRTTTQEVPRIATDTLGLKLTVVALPDTAHLNLGDASVYDLDDDLSATGMIVYNKTTDPTLGLMPCLYVWNGATWHPLKDTTYSAGKGIDIDSANVVSQSWFYYPSIPLPLSVGAHSIDLAAQYTAQYNASVMPPATDLDFEMLYFDNTVFTGASIAGVTLTYTIPVGAVVTENTYINMICRKK